MANAGPLLQSRFSTSRPLLVSSAASKDAGLSLKKSVRSHSARFLAGI